LMLLFAGVMEALSECFVYAGDVSSIVFTNAPALHTGLMREYITNSSSTNTQPSLNSPRNHQPQKQYSHPNNHHHQNQQSNHQHGVHNLTPQASLLALQRFLWFSFPSSLIISFTFFILFSFVLTVSWSGCIRVVMMNQVAMNTT
jgi:hypothetical protein